MIDAVIFEKHAWTNWPFCLQFYPVCLSVCCLVPGHTDSLVLAIAFMTKGSLQHDVDGPLWCTSYLPFHLTMDNILTSLCQPLRLPCLCWLFPLPCFLFSFSLNQHLLFKTEHGHLFILEAVVTLHLVTALWDHYCTMCLLPSQHSLLVCLLALTKDNSFLDCVPHYVVTSWHHTRFGFLFIFVFYDA